MPCFHRQKAISDSDIANAYRTHFLAMSLSLLLSRNSPNEMNQNQFFAIVFALWKRYLTEIHHFYNCLCITEVVHTRDKGRFDRVLTLSSVKLQLAWCAWDIVKIVSYMASCLLSSELWSCGLVGSVVVTLCSSWLFVLLGTRPYRTAVMKYYAI